MTDDKGKEVTEDIDTLLGRLRNAHDEAPRVWLVDVCKKAAAAIERLQAERDRSERALAAARADGERMREAIGRLEASQSDLDFLLKAVEAGDPINEIRIRIADMIRWNCEALAALTPAPWKGEGND